MKRPTEELLHDLLEETAPADFRTTLMQETLRHAGRRKRARQLRRGFGVVALAAWIAFTLWRPHGPVVATDSGRPPGLTIVSSQPLRPEQIVATRAGSAGMPVSVSTVAIVETSTSRPYYTVIDDRQLFAFLAGHPAALVRQGPDRSELIFVDPNDRENLVVP